jgi:preprotein translocase subunit SecD
MLYFSPWKVAAILIISVLAILVPLPNAFSPEKLKEYPEWAQKRMPLGLDLQGGAYLLMQMDIDDLRKNSSENIAAQVRPLLHKEDIRSSIRLRTGEVRVTILNPEQTEKALSALKTLAKPGMFGAPPEIEIKQEENTISLKPTQLAMDKRMREALNKAVEIVRLRVDPLGTKEIHIQRQGKDRILLEVPGLKNTTELKELVGKTAKLEFQLVDHSHGEGTYRTMAEARAAGIPQGSAIYEYAPGAGWNGSKYVLLKKMVLLTGADLATAKQDYDQQGGQPVVSFRFNPAGARVFGRITTKHEGKRFAILLDGKVISDPKIINAITGGSGQISGGFSVESANQLAILLNSGALPAKLTTKDESTVGASLGADAIEAGGKAMLIAFALVSMFMILGYGLFGLYSIVALVVNIGIIMASLTLLQASLTLAGIAGIALTMGVAVDANVLIFERIREELRSGKSNIVGIETGFRQAYATIIDSHLTGLLGGVILLWLASGSIRGFAVTFCIGIIASLFTAITLTRLIIAGWLRWKQPTVIPI